MPKHPDMTTPHTRLAAALSEMTSPTANRSNPAFSSRFNSARRTADNSPSGIRTIISYKKRC